MTKKLVLFDCDGTIVDSVGIIHGAMERTFAEAGHNVPPESATRSIIGLTLDIAIARIIGKPVDAEVLKMTERYKAHFHKIRAKPGFHEPLFEGMAELVMDLANHDDVVLGLVTGKSQRGVGLVFDTHGLHGHFVTIRTADDCPSKPDPAMVLECCAETGFDPSDCIVIGDSIYDMQMAKAAGAGAIGVAWGYNGVHLLREGGADDIARDVGELRVLLEQFYG